MTSEFIGSSGLKHQSMVVKVDSGIDLFMKTLKHVDWLMKLHVGWFKSALAGQLGSDSDVYERQAEYQAKY